MIELRLVALTVLGLTLGASPVGAQGVEVTVDAAKHHQTIEGFGTCLVAWRDEFRRLYRTEEFQEVYVNQVGCNMLRFNLWGPVCKTPQQDWRDIRWQDFDMSVNGGRAQIFIDFAKGIKKLNPDVKLIGTVWSPPAWMKESQSITDKRSGGIRAHSYGEIRNRVRPEFYPHFARWLVEMVKLHAAAGTPLCAVSPGNEVQFTQTFESCVWNGEDFAKIVAMVGELLDKEGLGNVKIFGPETMTSHFYTGGTPDYVKAVAGSPAALQALDVWATHGYEDGVVAEMNANSSRRMWNIIKEYGKPYWVTEGGTGGHDWPTPLHKGVGAAIHNALVAGDVSAFVPWQVIDGDRNTHGLMVLEGGRPVFTPKTYAAMHYFRFIRPGAVRIDAEPAYAEVMTGAFYHPQRSELTIVLLNPTDQRQPVTVRFQQPPGIEAMKAYGTSASANLEELPAVPVKGDRLTLTMPEQSMLTLFAGRR